MKTIKLTRLFATLLILMAATIGQQAWAQTTWTVESSTSGNVTTFTVKRSKKGTAEQVAYRTVDLSAIGGLNYGRASGTLNFGVNDTEMIVRVTEIPPASVTEVPNRYQSGLVREYRFEVLDDCGFMLAEKTQQIDYGAAYKFSSNHINRGVTDLVYLNNSVFNSSCSNYYDVKYTPSTNTFITVTDAGYSQAVHTLSTDGIFTDYGLPRDYLTQIGDKLYATVCFYSADIADGYHYIQILADNDQTYDADDDNGAVSTPSRSIYKAAFEEFPGNMNGSANWFFPHRYDYQTLDDAIGAGVGSSTHGEFYTNVNKLYQQKFHVGINSAHPTYRAANSGSLLLPPSVSNLNIRFDASGSGNDDWQFKNLFVRLALSDEAAPSPMNAYVGQGPYYKYNRFTVSLLFSEIVDGRGTVLHTSWGDLNCVQNDGSKSNLLTFSGSITANAGTTLTITGLDGTVKDLVGNALQGLGNKTFSCTVSALPAPLVGGVYQISNVGELYAYADILATNPNASAVLTADIDVSNAFAATGFTAMGGANGFSGTFDGQGHTISGIQNLNAVNGYIGLFCKIAATGKVRNLNVNISQTQVPIASIGGICGLNLGTIELCSVGGNVTTSLMNASSATTSTYVGGICAENRGTVSNCYTTADVMHKWQNAPAGGIVGKNAGTMENCHYYGTFTSANSVTRGAVCAENTGTVRNCYARNRSSNYFSSAIGSNTGTAESTELWEQSQFDSGRVCFLLNGGVTDGTQVWYQTLGDGITGTYPVFDTAAGTVYQHTETIYANTVHTPGNPEYVFTENDGFWYCKGKLPCSLCGIVLEEEDGTPNEDVTTPPTCRDEGVKTLTFTFENPAFTTQTKEVPIPANTDHTPGNPEYVFTEDDGFWYCKGKLPCSLCGTVYVEEDGTPNENVTTAPTCLEEGVKTWTFTFENPVFTAQTKEVPVSALGHLYESDPVWIWTSDLTSTIARFTCARCNTTQDYDATVTVVEGVITVTVTVYGTTYTNEFKHITLNSGTYPGCGIYASGNGNTITDQGSMLEGVPVYLGVGNLPAGASVSWTVSDADNQTVTVHEGADGQFFIMPNKNVTIDCTISVPYVAADGTTQYCTAFTNITSNNGDTEYGTSNTESWYVVTGNVEINGRLKFNGISHVILTDGGTLTVTNNNSDAIMTISGNVNPGLYIYCQTGGTGSLIASATHPTITDYNALDIGGVLVINGGNVTCEAIYTAIRTNYDITINGGNVNATSTNRYGIYAPRRNIFINGGNVNATGGTYGFGDNNIYLGWSELSDRIYASSYNGNVCVIGNQALTEGTGIYSDQLSADEKSAIAGKTLQPCIALTDGDDNAATIEANDNTNIAVGIAGRTLYRDGYWNTLCLPFNIDIFTNTPLEGATVMSLGSSSFANGKLTLNFETAESIVAGKPYIVKWTTTGSDVQPPVFMDVTLRNVETANAVTDCIDFIGTFAPVQFTDGDRSILFMGAESTLYYPAYDAYVNAFRGYFQLKGGLLAGESISPVKEFELNFGGETTSIKTTNLSNFTNEDGSWYDLSGRKLNGKPTAPGLYLNNGHKVLIKNEK